ncbi:MAG TPA: hypothetical protein DCW64_08400 [Lactococcus lactis]|nr:hypothetical protein [Lactococcus lactis]
MIIKRNHLLYLCTFNVIAIFLIIRLYGINFLSISTMLVLLLVILRSLWAVFMISTLYLKKNQSKKEEKIDK